MIAFGQNAFLRDTDPANMPPVTTLYVNSNFFGGRTLTSTLAQLDGIDVRIDAGGHLDT